MRLTYNHKHGVTTTFEKHNGRQSALQWFPVRSRLNPSNGGHARVPHHAQPTWTVHSSRPSGGWGPEQCLRSKRALGLVYNSRASDDPHEVAPTETSSKNREWSSVAALAATIAVVVVTGILNRVLYKMALMPLGDHVFFLAQLQTFGYVIVYFGALWFRISAKNVTPEMMSVPRRMSRTFIFIGFIEALSSVLSLTAAAHLPGIVLPLLSQTVLFWQVLLAYVVLGKRLQPAQIVGVSAVVVGVVLAAWPSASAPSFFGHVSPLYAAMFVTSMLFPALDTILKENLFRVGKTIAKGKDLDLFVVNSFASGAQALFVFALLPVMTAFRGMPFSELPSYLASGWECCLGRTPACGGDCSGAPWLPLLYVGFNLAFNIAALRLIRQAGNVAMSLVMSAIVPATIAAFTLPLPYLGAAPPLGPRFFLGSIVLVIGLACFNGPLWIPALRTHLSKIREQSYDDWRGLRKEG